MPQNGPVARRRQPVLFDLVQIYDQSKRCARQKYGVQDTDAARLDQTGNGIGGRGHNPATYEAQHNTVISNKLRAIGHQRQRQCGFAGPAFAQNQNRRTVQPDASSVQMLIRG